VLSMEPTPHGGRQQRRLDGDSGGESMICGPQGSLPTAGVVEG
jgi:hypothetical protein